MKLRYYILAGVALLGMSSCSDFLDKPSDTRVTLTNTEQLRMLMTSAYPEYSYVPFCEISTDNFIDNNSPGIDGVRFNLPSYDRNDDEAFAFEDIRTSSGEDTPSGSWEGYYNAIATCNQVLEKVEEFENNGENSAKLQAVKGEALVDRAYCHFMLANIFCMPYRGPELSNDPATCPGIPYMTKPETTVKPHYERGTLAETYAKIEKDIEDGLPLINDAFFEQPKYHFNKQAAYTFASRFYLFKRDYQKVLECANTAFGGADVDPMPYMTDIWAHSDELTYDDDFNRYYADPAHMRNFMIIPTYSVYRRHLTSGNRYACNREAMKATVWDGRGPTWTGVHPCYNGCGMFVAGSNQNYGLWWGAPVGEQFEYTDKVAGIGYAHQVLCEFTGEEALLNRAEAKLFLGDIDGAVADLGVWEAARRNTKNSTSSLKPWSKEIVWNFYTTAEEKYVYNNRPERREVLGAKYLDSLYFGIAKPLHIDIVCPSAQYHNSPEINPILQCIQHFRRIEFLFRGMRWFDIKRYGISYSHVIGKDSRVVTLNPNIANGELDKRLALQIPNEVIAAGIEPNDRAPLMTQDHTSFKKAVVPPSNDE